jgi:hypothetical protein
VDISTKAKQTTEGIGPLTTNFSQQGPKAQAEISLYCITGGIDAEEAKQNPRKEGREGIDRKREKQETLPCL